MQDFNQVTFIGRLGRDPEMSYTPNGNAVTKFSIAVNRRKDAKGNEQKAMWFNVVCWQRLGEVVNEYAHKGSKVLVQGIFDQREYKDRDGVNRIAYEIIASTVQLLDGKPKETTDSKSGSADPLGDLDEHPF
jgi:single-strand DNA-binding protein